MIGYDAMTEITEAASNDIAPHLWTLYWLARFTRGCCIECGVRDGDSTRALLAGCVDSGKVLYSYDIMDCRPSVEWHIKRLGLEVLLDRWRFEQRSSVQAA